MYRKHQEPVVWAEVEEHLNKCLKDMMESNWPLDLVILPLYNKICMYKKHHKPPQGQWCWQRGWNN
jgi:hypothetical protein